MVHKPGFDSRAWQQSLHSSEWGLLGVSAVNLYQSTTLAGGAQYRILHSIALKAD